MPAAQVAVPAEVPAVSEGHASASASDPVTVTQHATEGALNDLRWLRSVEDIILDQASVSPARAAHAEPVPSSGFILLLVTLAVLLNECLSGIRVGHMHSGIEPRCKIRID